VTTEIQTIDPLEAVRKTRALFDDQSTWCAGELESKGRSYCILGGLVRANGLQGDAHLITAYPSGFPEMHPALAELFKTARRMFPHLTKDTFSARSLKAITTQDIESLLIAINDIDDRSEMRRWSLLPKKWQKKPYHRVVAVLDRTIARLEKERAS